MKYLCVVVSLLLALSFVAMDSEAVIFASDIYYLYEDGGRIEDNSVLMRVEDGTVDVCVGGKFEYRQNLPRVVMLYRTDDTKIPTELAWLASFSGQGKDREDYEVFLEEKARECLFSTKAILPGRTDYNTYDAPKEGMTGGRIGSFREYRLDVVSGKTRPVDDAENAKAEVKTKGSW